MKTSEFQIQYIINNELVTSFYQPIITLHNGEIIGYEALSRGPEGSELYSPLAMIQLAEKEGCLWELEMLFRKKAIESAAQLLSNHLLFVNVDPNILHEQSYTKGFTKKYLVDHHVNPRHIVFEITEHTAIKDYETFTEIINHYRSQDYKIAIDDVGSGYSGLKTLTEIHPEYVKIDMDLIRDINADAFKQAIIKSLVYMAKETNIKLIAEGVETKEELETLIKLDVYAAQGYYLHRPAPIAVNSLPDIRDLILQLNRDIVDAFSFDAAYFCVGKIANTQRTYSKDLSSGAIKDIFEHNDMDSICLVNKDKYPEGLMMKNQLNSKLADRYGFDLYYQKCICHLMDTTPLVVDYYTPVTKVLNLAMQRNKSKLFDDIIVTQCSLYYGMTTVYDLIRNSTEYEKLYAKQQNPLTALPGNTIIRQLMEQYINNNEVVGVMYIDIDHFKAYNDVYGFEKGDLVIKSTANLIVDVIKQSSHKHFVGHIGGDDFFALIKGTADDVAQISQTICLEFDRLLPQFFSHEDLAKGHYLSNDRYNKQVLYPLNSISIAAYYGTIAPFITPENLGEHMSSLKRQVKAQDGSIYQLFTCA